MNDLLANIETLVSQFERGEGVVFDFLNNAEETLRLVADEVKGFREELEQIAREGF